MEQNEGLSLKCIRATWRVFYLVFLLALLLTGCFPVNLPMWDGYPLQYGAEGSDSSLLVIRDEKGLFGYCDATGKIMIKPGFDDARPFYENLAAVRKGNRYGYIDKAGKTVIPFDYYGALDFHNGKAFVGTELEHRGEMNAIKCCLIDKEGRPLTQPEPVLIGDFSDGMIIVFGNGENYYFDTEHEKKVKMDFIIYTHDSPAFSEGLAAATANRYVDKNGNTAITGAFTQIRPFSGGLAPVCAASDSGENLWGYINKSGRFAINPQFLDAYGFGEGIACAQGTDGRWMLINEKGEKVCFVQGYIGIAKPFSEEMCAVGRYKTDIKGFNFSDERFFWGFIDSSGKLVVDFQYDMVSSFKNGIAQVMVDGRIGYIDKTGKYIWEPK